MAYVSTIVSGAACLGVLIGLISGIFLLVLAAVKWVSRVRSSLHEEELTRQKKFIVDSTYLPGSQDFPEAKKTENGFVNKFNGSAKKADHSFQSGAQNPVLGSERPREQNGSEGGDPGSDTVKVRELMEKMVETMIGGPLDGTTVGQLSTHSAYKNEDSKNVKDSNLKRLIKKIIDQAMALPDIKEVPGPLKTPKDPTAEDFDSKSYEDILATAILNKVIETFQSNNLGVSDSAAENPKPRIRHRKLRKSDGNDDLKSDGDWSDTSRSDQLSLTIEEYIEEVTTALEVSEDERTELSDLETTLSRRIPFPESGRTVVDAGTDDENSDIEEQSTATELVTSTSSWEENWLFQKKRLRSTPNAHHPVPVPMLVPNPSEDFRALVGGVDADDLSDMSECSDSVLEELVTTEEKPAEISREKFEEPRYSIVSTSSSEEEVGGNKHEKVKIILTHITEESFYEKLNGQGIQNDTKNEDCGAVELEKESGPEAIEEVPKKSPEDEQPAVESLPPVTATNGHSLSAESTLISTTTDSEDGLIRCRVAEREKEKWMNPVPLAVNPYSPENIEKRAQQRKRNEYFRIGTYTGESIDFPDEQSSSDELSKTTVEKPCFTRDYYVNASKHPSGMSSPSSDQVSRHYYEVLEEAFFSPRSNRPSRSRPSPVQAMASQHFSQVFRTSAFEAEGYPKTKAPRRQRHVYHTVKLRPRTKESLQRRASLQQELSYFEQNSLRGNLTHALLRAKGASPNFTLNPVFDPDLPEDPFPALPYDVNRDHGRAKASTSRKSGRMSQESGYGSDFPDHSSDSLEFWRLTPPKTPEVVESAFVPILSIGKAKEKRKALSGIF